MSNLSTLGTAFSGMQAAQAGMLITSQNVSGSAVEGYSRRRVEVVMSGFAPGASGAGVSTFAVDGFTRDYSVLIENQRGRQYGRAAEFKTKAESASTLDAVVLDAASSIGNSLDKFFSAAGALSRDPGSVSFKAQFFSSANQLAERFSGVNDTLKALRDGAKYGAKEAIENVNRLASQLASVNEKIFQGSTGGALAPSPDLLDRRDQMLMALQKEIGGQSVINSDGMANLYVNGNPVVHLNEAATLQFSNDQVFISFGGKIDLVGSKLAVEGNAAGRVRGYLSMLNDFIPELETRVSEMAKGVADQVNSKLASGGMQPAPGGALFDYDEVGTSGKVANFRVRDDLDTGASVLLASEAKAIEAIRLNTDSPITKWASFTTFVGGTIASWKADFDAAETVALRLDQDRERLSGVNLDEEAANLIRFQQLYGAASKVLQIGSQLFDQLLSVLR